MNKYNDISFKSLRVSRGTQTNDQNPIKNNDINHNTTITNQKMNEMYENKASYYHIKFHLKNELDHVLDHKLKDINKHALSLYIKICIN